MTDKMTDESGQSAGFDTLKVHKFELPPIGIELYEHYPSMSAQTHEEDVKHYARVAIAAALSAQVQDVAGQAAATTEALVQAYRKGANWTMENLMMLDSPKISGMLVDAAEAYAAKQDDKEPPICGTTSAHEDNYDAR